MRPGLAPASGTVSIAFRDLRKMKIRVEILRWEKSGEEPRVLYSLSHEGHSVGVIKRAVETVIESVSMPEPPHGYRIITEQGTELYGWAD